MGIRLGAGAACALLILGGAMTACGARSHEGSPGAASTAAAAPAERTFTVRFRAQVGARAFSCGESFEGIGRGATSFRPLDFRFWVHDVRLVRKGGDEVSLRLGEDHATGTLEDDGAWQTEGLALLDFEDATGTCEGTSETRSVVVGSAPGYDDYEALTFRVGVPKERNHIDAPSAPYPLGAPGMAWQWKTGYRFVRLDVATPRHPRHLFHLGSSACDVAPDAASGFFCAVENVPTIRLEGFDPDASVVVADVAAVYAGLDVDGEETSACMSGGSDNPLCPSLFAAFGLSYGGGPSPAQSVFRVER